MNRGDLHPVGPVCDAELECGGGDGCGAGRVGVDEEVGGVGGYIGELPVLAVDSVGD